MPGTIKRLLVGRPLHNEEIVKEKLPKWKALSIFSSDALSSIGYGPEQIVLILAVPGALVYGYSWMVAAAILITLGIVSFSYVQVAQANPGGGGSYSVASKNLNETAALTAAAALFIDYCLTVAVSISSGTDAIISAFPVLVSYRLEINIIVLFGVLMLINLRGVRESSNAFVFPTYAFIFGIMALIIAGIYHIVSGQGVVVPQTSLEKQPMNWAVLYLFLRAFASGCSSFTGTEAISNGVPMFKEPAARNAQVTTYWMASILAVMFAGIVVLILHYHILPVHDVTIVSQVAELTFGRTFMYYFIQITTMFVLYLAANTAYNGLPPLLSILARDGYMPRYLSARGDRLTFHNGIFLLSVVAAFLIVVYHGNTEHLISLYALGVFLSFTIAQTGMVIHWRRERSAGWPVRAFLNGLGAVVTGIVVLVIVVAKFFYGAWVIILVIPIIIYIFKKIHSHYNDMRDQLVLPADFMKPGSGASDIGVNYVLVPVAGVTKVVQNTIAYARSISDNVVALHVSTDEAAGNKVRARWQAWDPGVELVVINSPYRTVMSPIIDYVDRLQAKIRLVDYITVLIPEFETRKWWHRLLHNQTGWILRTFLTLNKNVVITVVPYHLHK